MQPTFKHSVRGFSVLELMVAMAISLLLLMGVVALFVSSRASYETTERLSRIQENGRFALDQLTNDLRATGFQGCSRAVNTSRRVDYAINRLTSPTSLTWNFGTTVQGYDGVGGSTFSPALDTTVTFSPSPPRPIGDVLVLRIPRREAQVLYTTDSASGTAPLTVDNVTPAPFQAGDTVMVTDCEARAWFLVTGYSAGVIDHAASPSSTPGNVDGDLLHPFRADSQIVPVDTIVYYLAQSSQFPADRSRLSLWRKTGNAAVSDEIADGIDRLEVQYGVEVAGAVTYMDASAVTNWDTVVTVRIAVLARAPDAYGNDLDTQAHVLFSSPTRVATAPYNDRFQRKVFTATIALRNQIFD
jgi:type IV pilus assembly protein PilW